MHETIEKNNPALRSKGTLESYISDMIADIRQPVPMLQWEMLPPKKKNPRQRYRAQDADGNIVTLSWGISEAGYNQHTLRVVDSEGRPMMGCMAGIADGYYSDLDTLYALITNRLQTGKPEKVEPGARYASPEQTDCFIRGMLTDAKSQHPLLHWERDDCDGKIRFRSGGLGKGNSIFVQQDYEDGERDSYTMEYHRDGHILASCTETAKLGENPDCQLRELFHLIAKNNPDVTDVDIDMPEIHRYVADVQMQQMLERIHGDPKNGPPLVGDLFRQANLGCVVRKFLLAAIQHSHGLGTNELEKLRLQRLAEYTVGAIRCTKRTPNGTTFTTRVIPVAYDDNRMTSRTVKMTSSLQRISNAYTTWMDILADTDLPRQAKVNRICVLLLMAILKDEIP